MGVPEDQLKRQQAELEAAAERDRKAAAENLARMQKQLEENRRQQEGQQ